ncbi:MAG: hypothetical protein ACXWQR_11225 [Ktedonobacterales bacterium]
MSAIAIPPIPCNPTPRLSITTMATPTTYGKSGNDSGNDSGNKIGNTGNAAYLLTHVCPAPMGAPTSEKTSTHATSTILATSAATILARFSATKSAKTAMSPAYTSFTDAISSKIKTPAKTAMSPAIRSATILPSALTMLMPRPRLTPVRAGGLCGAQRLQARFQPLAAPPPVCPFHSTHLTGNISGKNSGNEIGKNGNEIGNFARMRKACRTTPLPRTRQGQGWGLPHPQHFHRTAPSLQAKGVGS